MALIARWKSLPHASTCRGRLRKKKKCLIKNRTGQRGLTKASKTHRARYGGPVPVPPARSGPSPPEFAFVCSQICYRSLPSANGRIGISAFPGRSVEAAPRQLPAELHRRRQQTTDSSKLPLRDDFQNDPLHTGSTLVWKTDKAEVPNSYRPGQNAKPSSGGQQNTHRYKNVPTSSDLKKKKKKKESAG